VGPNPQKNASAAVGGPIRRAFLSTANVVLHAAHIALILLVLGGWWFCATRLLSDALIVGTLFSWYGLKPILAKDSGYGYCLITDLQWRIRRHMNLPAPTGGYMKYLADKLLGGDRNLELIEKATAMTFFLCVAGSIATTIFFGWC
jgi:Protein of Unknown function (DUF2784)